MNKKIIQRLSSLFIIIIFIGFIFGLSILSIYDIINNYSTYSYYENRSLASFPEIEKKSIFNGSFFTQVEDWYRDHSAKRNNILAYDTLLNMNVLKRPVINKTVITKDVLLPYNAPEMVDRAEVRRLAKEMGQRLLSHSDLCASYGGKFYYVAVPCQYVYYEDKYPWYLNSRAEYTAETSTALFSVLDELGVSYIDMLEVFNKNGHLPEYSSTIDNHYSIFGALEIYNMLMNKINEDTGLNLHIMTEGNYTTTTLPNNYLGSRKRKLLGLWKSDEKMSIITPNESIQFTRFNWGSETPGAPIVYSIPANETDDVLYSLYMGGDYSMTKIETNRPDLPTLLVYGDSFTNALESLIWYNFDTMYSLDFRYYSDMTLEEFIEKYKPDVVVCVRDYEQLINASFNGQ